MRLRLSIALREAFRGRRNQYVFGAGASLGGEAPHPAELWRRFVISTDEAALIATILPISLIVLAFGRRSPRPKVSTGKRLIWELARLFAGGIVVCLSLYSKWRCVFSVSSATPLGGTPLRATVTCSGRPVEARVSRVTPVSSLSDPGEGPRLGSAIPAWVTSPASLTRSEADLHAVADGFRVFGQFRLGERAAIPFK